MSSRIVLLIGLWLCCLGCNKKQQEKTAVAEVESTVVIKTYNFKAFESAFLTPKKEKIQVINFWATWCRPCVKELPYFEKLTKEQKGVEVILVSLDLTTQKESKLIPFVIENKLQSTVIHLDEPDADAWISKVSANWSGAIPATIIRDKNKKTFYEQSFNYQQLVEAINIFKNEKE